MKNIIEESLVDREDNIDEEYEKECLVYVIKKFCRYLDFLSSCDIEERLMNYWGIVQDSNSITGCYFSCCGDEDVIETMISSAEKDNVFGEGGLQFLYQLNEKYLSLVARNYDREKGFSKTQRWRDFIVLVNTVNLFFKDTLKQYEKN